jgi:hypothetical protein
MPSKTNEHLEGLSAREREELERKLRLLIERFDSREVDRRTVMVDGGCDPLWGRFNRSAINQICGGSATLSRYSIWANTVRDNIIEGLSAAEEGDQEKVQYHLIRAANSLSAFSDFQCLFGRG